MGCAKTKIFGFKVGLYHSGGLFEIEATCEMDAWSEIVHMSQDILSMQSSSILFIGTTNASKTLEKGDPVKVIYLKDNLYVKECDMTEEFVIRNADKIDMDMHTTLFIEKKFSINFINRFKRELNWVYLCSKYDFSEEELIMFKEYLDWYGVTSNQKLSDQFLEDHMDQIDLSAVYQNKRISKNFKHKYRKAIKDAFDEWSQLPF